MIQSASRAFLAACPVAIAAPLTAPTTALPRRIPVKQGSEGLNEFTTRIRELFRLPEDVDISLTFGCKASVTV